MMKHPSRYGAPGLFLAGLLVWGCGGDEPPAAPTPPPQPATAQKAEAKAPPKAEEKPAEELDEYSYSPVGKRDPFRSYIVDQAPAVVEVADPRCGVLCSWDLDQLRLVAVVSGVASPMGMVEDPRGRGHVVRRGMSIGKRSGKVTEIHRDRLIVTEILRGPKGQAIPTKTDVMLRAKGQTSEAQLVDLTPQDAQEE